MSSAKCYNHLATVYFPFPYTGVNECDSKPCLNGGKCVNLNTEDAGSGSGLDVLHKCVCAPGYTGKLCETSK